MDLVVVICYMTDIKYGWIIICVMKLLILPSWSLANILGGYHANAFLNLSMLHILKSNNHLSYAQFRNIDILFLPCSHCLKSFDSL